MKNTALDLLMLTVFVTHSTSYELKQQLVATMVSFSKTKAALLILTQKGRVSGPR